MALESGTRLAHYEITDQIGKGGMGEVYRARDTKLGREVAIKTLPDEFAADADRLHRFEREAKLLASLNHPNIAGIYGLDEHEGSRFLVLELVEGNTLGDRIKAAAIPVEESINLALQIAGALKAAHERGVIHRDLKPDNIKVSAEGNVKVLDFGLAKALSTEETDVNLSNSPTLSMAATRAGVILGTAAYMSPEQAKGLRVDRRADIWAFGCVLFEILTGRQSFGKSEVAESLSAVISLQPEWDALPGNLDPRLREIVERCLEKSVEKRYQDIGDVSHDIGKVLATPGGGIGQPDSGLAVAGSRSRVPWIAAMLLMSAMTGTVAWNLKPSDPRPLRRFDYALPAGIDFAAAPGNVLAVAPDGSYVYNGTGGLYLKPMDQVVARLIPGTEGGATNPSFSPDGRSLVFWREGRIETLAIAGGTPREIGRAPSFPFGLSWGEDDTVLFGQSDGIYRVAASGGSPQLVIEAEVGELLSSPQLLPGGKGILFTSGQYLAWDNGQIFVQSLDAPGDRTEVLSGGNDARYVPTGHLIFALGDDLFAIAFDPDTLKTSGVAVSLVQGLTRAAGTDGANYGISADGSLVYVNAAGGSATRSMVWVSRDGTEEPVGLPADAYLGMSLSPDGTHVATSLDTGGGNEDVWVSDLTRDPPTLSPVTSDPGREASPIWTPDGERIVFESDREGNSGLFSKRADGTGLVARLLMTGEGWPLVPSGWSRDGRTLVFSYVESGTNVSIGTLSMDGDSDWNPLLNSEGVETHAAISPNGDWIAYTLSGANGRAQVFVERFPDLGERVPVSTTGGGMRPIWSDDGAELFYQRLDDNATMAVPLETEPAFRPVTAQVLIPNNEYVSGGRTPILNYAYDSENQRFLMFKTESEGTRPRIITVLNWFGELRERVPVN